MKNSQSRIPTEAYRELAEHLYAYVYEDVMPPAAIAGTILNAADDFERRSGPAAGRRLYRLPELRTRAGVGRSSPMLHSRGGDLGVSPSQSKRTLTIMGFEGFPFIVGWELTLACNLRCRHCGSSAALPRSHELSLEESLTTCEQLPALLVQEVDFTGGEPLLRPDWPRIAARLGELGIRSKIITNGLTLGADTIAEIGDAGIAGVGVSIDGLEATHDAIRGHDGLFELAVAGIERVLEAGLPVSVLTTVNALNINELPALASLLTSLGVQTWQVQPMFHLGRGQSCTELQLSERSFMQLGTFVQEWGSPTAEAGLELMPGDSFGYFTDLDTREPPWRGCSAGLASCGITSDGKIKGCLSLPDEQVEGDLRQHDLWDKWFHPSSFAYTRAFSVDGLGPACQGCDQAELCKGGCSAMSYGSTGRFHNDPFCFYSISRRDSHRVPLDGAAGAEPVPVRAGKEPPAR